MWLNCKVIKKWQLPISTSTPPPFQVYPLFLAKNFVTPLVTQFSDPFNKGGGGGSNYASHVKSYVCEDDSNQVATKVVTLLLQDDDLRYYSK